MHCAPDRQRKVGHRVSIGLGDNRIWSIAGAKNRCLNEDLRSA